MGDSLPSFGNISAIEPHGTSTHDHPTFNVTTTTDKMVLDSQETTFNDSQSASQRNEDFTSNHTDNEEHHHQNQEDSSTSIMEETATELAEEEFSTMVVEDSLPNDLSPQEESSNADHFDTEAASESELELNSSDQGMESFQDDETENTEGEVVDAGGGTDDEHDGDEEPGEKLYQLPISKIKRIMKTDPDTKLITKDALTVMAISTEHFLAMLAQQSFKLAVRSKKKRIALEHVKSTITSSASCDFLEGTIPEFDI